MPLPALVSAEVLRIPAHLRDPYTAMFRAQTDHTAAPAEITDATTTILGLAHQVIADKETSPRSGRSDRRPDHLPRQRHPHRH
ncbi:hypothetical protein [Streptomyces sp. NPDC090132]|uniref:hypothetical protein n=1 Tax=Streptomyces sp. NPDC090132 TaxID=3365955 RepID=UPI00380B991A